MATLKGVADTPFWAWRQRAHCISFQLHFELGGPMPPVNLQSALVAVGLQRQRQSILRRFREGSQGVFFWVATLEGQVILSEGGGEEADAFVGKRLGVDFGSNPEFFQAISQITSPDSSDELVMFSRGKADNDQFAGRHYLNVYTLLRTASGRPYSVAVTSVDFTAAIGESGYCGGNLAECPLWR